MTNEEISRKIAEKFCDGYKKPPAGLAYYILNALNAKDREHEQDHACNWRVQCGHLEQERDAKDAEAAVLHQRIADLEAQLVEAKTTCKRIADLKADELDAQANEWKRTFDWIIEHVEDIAFHAIEKPGNHAHAVGILKEALEAARKDEHA